MKSTGKVYLIGAGPGDPDLLTIKALRMLEKSDVVVYDRLVSPEILAFSPNNAKKISVGKSPDNHPVSQEEINKLLVKFAKEGHIVARLKGGDPLIFGRGAEEALYLNNNGISVEYAPGITAAQGVSLTCGVPLTYRNIATSVQIITGHKQSNSQLDFDWKNLANPDTTLIIYMGVSSIGNIAESLITAGLDKQIPVLAVENATTPQERKIVSQLNQISKDVSDAELRSPVVFIIGKVVSHSLEFSE